MTLKSIGQAILLMLGGWLLSLLMNVADYYIFGEEIGQRELWEDATSFVILILAAQFYKLRSVAIEAVKAFDAAGETK